MTELDWSYLARNVPGEGLAVTRAADAAERAAVAEAFEMVSCERLEVKCVVKALAQGRFRVTGTLPVDYTQSCVATLEPIPQKLRSDFRRELWPPDALPVATEAEIETLEDEPDTLEDGKIDIGRIIVEELAEHVDPYPRRPGASAEWREGDAPEKNNPFAGLRGLVGDVRRGGDDD